MKNNNVKKILCTGAILGVIGVSGIMAYLTDSESKTNHFTVGKVDIELIETNWTANQAPYKDTNGDGHIDENDEKTSTDAINIVANQTITKDPKIMNKGKNPAYVYLNVTVPVANVVTTNDDGTKKAAADTELFSYSINEGWKELNEKQPNMSGGKIISYTHTYYYTKELPKYNGENEASCTTPTLFDAVTFANITEDAVSGDTPVVASLQDIKVEAKAIQSDSLKIDGLVKDSEDYIKKAYEIYVNQNPGNA